MSTVKEFYKLKFNELTKTSVYDEILKGLSISSCLMDFCPLSKTFHPLFLIWRQNQAGWNANQNQIKNIHLFDILFQVLKVLLIKNYKIKLPVLLFFVVLHQP